jgi:hypothetical protein
LTIVSCGASTGVLTVLEQFAVVGQVGSPPPDTDAVFDNDVPLAAAVGVTGITKLTELPVARPAEIVQVTCWPVAVQPAGNVPIVSVPGITSVIVAAAVVAAVPVFVTCSV